MKKLLLVMSLALILCGVSYAENDDSVTDSTNLVTTSNEEMQTTSSEETQTTSSEETQTTSSEEIQTTSSEEMQTTSSEEIQTTSSEEIQTTSDEEIQTTSSEEIQTTSDEEIETTGSEQIETAGNEERETNLITKISEDIHNKLYSQELQDAYDFAFNNKITTMDSINSADLEGGLTRIAMAKMLSNYATNILGKEPDNIIVPQFSDVSQKLNEEYGNAVDLAYQLGIMGIGIDEFRPYDPVTRAEFATALSRMLYGLADGLDKYYTTHMEKLKEEGIISNTDPSLKELRGYVMIMLMRSAKAKLGVIKDVIENKLVEDYKKLAEDNQILIDNL